MDFELKNKIIINFVRESDKVKEEKRALEKISDLLTGICDESKKEKEIFYKPLKSFYSRNIPIISIKEYLQHVYKYSRFNSSTIILILIYIDRICNINKCKLSYYNIHKLILGSMIVAIKYNEDEYFSNNFYAKVGGISVKDLDFLEYVFLTLIDFQLFVDEDLYNKYSNYILSIKVDE